MSMLLKMVLILILGNGVFSKLFLKADLWDYSLWSEASQTIPWYVNGFISAPIWEYRK